jgi:hypothetical protein
LPFSCACFFEYFAIYISFDFLPLFIVFTPQLLPPLAIIYFATIAIIARHRFRY